MPDTIRVHHIITALTTGGAEMMLLRLLEKTDRERFTPVVISLRDVNVMGERMQRAGVEVRALGLDPRRPNPAKLWRLRDWLRRDRPHVIQTWMTHADLIGGFAARLAGGIPVAWGLHVGHLDRRTHGRTAILTARLNARLSRYLPTKIVCCSETARLEHARLGYVESKMIVIPNGFDLDLFKPDPEARRSLRRELGLGEDALLIGQVGRFHAQKDHQNLLSAMHRVWVLHPEAHLVLLGREVTTKNAQLLEWVGAARARVHILGERSDTPRVNAALDIACSSSSYGEAFPLVIGEAMAAGVPCVVTDCGDSARMVADTGRVVPIRNPAAFAGALAQLIDLGAEGRRLLGEAARRRVESRFAIADIVERYQTLYEELAGRRNDASRSSA